jgi:two-component system, OmpR family, sensor histidine kinase KdpD
MAEAGIRRPDPEALLRRVEAEARAERRGTLKIFLGYASGVGKTLRMFNEGARRKSRGEDVVVASVQQELSADVNAVLESLEQIPARTDLSAPCIDVAAVKRRRPGVCLIDGLAYRNPAGNRNAERWQDVEELLAAGISVITTINVQYVREKQAEVEAIRGKRVRDSVPERFLRLADEIEVVDAPPEYCVTLAQAGGDASPAEVERQLSTLRQMALVLAAEVVDHQLEDYLQRHGIEQPYGTHERILVCMTPRSNAAEMIRRGRRQADRFHGELHVVYVQQDDLSDEDRRTLERNLEAARGAHARVEVLDGEDAIGAILEYARSHGMTQIFAGHSQRGGWLNRLRVNPLERLILEAEGIDVRVFPQEATRDD